MTTRLGNINLFVQNVERAMQFYVNVIGLELDEQRSVLPGFALLKAGTCTLTLQDRSAPEAAFGPANSIELGFEVDDVQLIRQRFVENNLQAENVQEMGWGSGFNTSDPDSHRLTVFRMHENEPSA